jgi:hypothetical protein
MPDRPPSRVGSVLSKIAQDKSMNDGVKAMMARAPEFDSTLAAKLTGVALVPQARAMFDRELDMMWASAAVPQEAPEIVVGAGLHAAIYCAVRVAEGHPKPLVIEAQPRAGGIFAVSRDSTFYLNSRNRPGNLGIPGRGEALNVLPGAPVQPADLSGDEYQPNSALSFSIRTALAMNARVIVGREVVEANSTSVTLADGKTIKTARVIYATGLGEPKGPAEMDGERMMSYPQFLASLDQPFPFQGLKRVAVIGAGDAGKTVIEAMTGQGPSSQMSVASLDFIETIDWYGVPESCAFRAGWKENNRSRYQGIARLLPTDIDGTDARVKPIRRRADSSGVAFEGAYVDGARYDLVVWATGFNSNVDVADMAEYRAGGRVVARMKESGVFVVGPAAAIVVTPEANVPQTVPENTAAVFRYADRTASLAMHLPALALPESPATTTPSAVMKRKPTKKVKRVKLDKRLPENWEKGDPIVRGVDGTRGVVYSRQANGMVSVKEGGRRPRSINPAAWRYDG